jgi:hypothetical protein
MISAAVKSRWWVFRILPAGRDSLSSGAPLTNGIIATPVSKPDNPSASFDKQLAFPPCQEALQHSD